MKHSAPSTLCSQQPHHQPQSSTYTSGTWWEPQGANHREGFWRQAAGPTPRASDSGMEGWVWKCTFLTCSQGMLRLMVHSPHFENHWYKKYLKTSVFWKTNCIHFCSFPPPSTQGFYMFQLCIPSAGCCYIPAPPSWTIHRYLSSLPNHRNWEI